MELQLRITCSFLQPATLKAKRYLRQTAAESCRAVNRHSSPVIYCMKKYLPLLFVLQSCIGWGDTFAKREQIIGDYYLVENENSTYDISYKIGGAYIGRSPSGGQVIAYAVRDTVLVMKIQPYNGEPFFYAINMKKDRDIAKQKEYELGRVAAKDYQRSWLARMSLNFQDVK